MEINGKELKGKEENHNVQGIPHTQSQSSRGHRISAGHTLTGEGGAGGWWILFLSLIEQLASTARHIQRPQIHKANINSLCRANPLDDYGRQSTGALLQFVEVVFAHW